MQENETESRSLSGLLGVEVAGADTAAATRADLMDLINRAGEMDRPALAEAVATLMEGDGLQRCSTLARIDPPGWEAVCMRLAAVRGMTQPVKRLRTLVKGALRGLSIASDSVPGDGTAGRPVEGLPWVASDWTCPPGWTVKADGIWGPDPTGEGDVFVSTVPLLPVGRLLDVDTGDHHVRLQWPGWTGAVYSRVVRQSVVVDARTLTAALGDRGSGVTSGNASMVVRFLTAALAHNASRMQVERVASRCGWVSDGTADGFLLGSDWVGSTDVVSLQVDPGSGEAQLLSGIEQAGTFEGWMTALAGAADCPDVHLAVYASVASVLVNRLGTARGWVIDWSGETSQGKTTALRVAASVWGEPVDGRLIGSWRATPVQIEASAALFQHLPLILDDSKNARKTSDIAAVIYQHSQGRGKGRGKPGVGSQAVGMRRTAEWRSVLLSTGEQSAVSFTQDAGSRARCLCLVGPPLRSDSQARDLTVGVLDHHGHLGRRVIEYLTGRDVAWWQQVSDRYGQRVSAWSERLADAGAVAQRLGALLALMEASKGIAEAVGYLPPPPGTEPIARAAAAVRVGSANADRPLEALRAVYGYCASRSTHLWHRHIIDRDGEARTPGGGWLGVWPKTDTGRRSAGWELAVLPATVDRVLQDCGFDTGVIDRWQERGWLARVGTSHRVRTRIDGVRVRCLAFTADAIEALDLG